MTAVVFEPGRVLNVRDGKVEGAVLVDRQTRYGNRFVIGPDGTREEVIALHKREIAEQIARGEVIVHHDLDRLKGRDVMCWCAPFPCHGDILVELAVMSRSRRLEWSQELMEHIGNN